MILLEKLTKDLSGEEATQAIQEFNNCPLKMIDIKTKNIKD